jgi:hypothetical protein
MTNRSAPSPRADGQPSQPEVTGEDRAVGHRRIRGTRCGVRHGRYWQSGSARRRRRRPRDHPPPSRWPPRWHWPPSARVRENATTGLHLADVEQLLGAVLGTAGGVTTDEVVPRRRPHGDRKLRVQCGPNRPVVDDAIPTEVGVIRFPRSVVGRSRRPQLLLRSNPTNGPAKDDPAWTPRRVLGSRS